MIGLGRSLKSRMEGSWRTKVGHSGRRVRGFSGCLGRAAAVNLVLNCGKTLRMTVSAGWNGLSVDLSKNVPRNQATGVALIIVDLNNYTSYSAAEKWSGCSVGNCSATDGNNNPAFAAVVLGQELGTPFSVSLSSQLHFPTSNQLDEHPHGRLTSSMTTYSIVGVLQDAGGRTMRWMEPTVLVTLGAYKTMDTVIVKGAAGSSK